MKPDRWATYKTPRLMLRLIGAGQQTDERKLRLFAVACCRRAWDDLADGPIRRLVVAQEEYADGRIDKPTLRRAIVDAATARAGPRELQYQIRWFQFFGVCFGPDDASWTISAIVGRRACREAGIANRSPERDECYRLARDAESHAQADLLREVFGNPFRPSEIDPSWLNWNGGTIPAMAGAIYQERAFDRLPILADALEEAGCVDADLLDHCRAPAGHVRGCWAVDALLGRR